MDFCEDCGERPAFCRYEGKRWCPGCFIVAYPTEGPAARWAKMGPKMGPKMAERYRRGIAPP